MDLFEIFLFQDGRSALHLAAKERHWDVVDWLVQKGAASDKEDKVRQCCEI